MKKFNCLKSLFKSSHSKKQKNEPEVQIKEVPVHSRFTFAHDPKGIEVKKYYLNTDIELIKPRDIQPEQIFIVKTDNNYFYNNKRVYHVFKMPSILPKTKLISLNKIICIGSIVTDNELEILYTTPIYAGQSLLELYITDPICHIILNNEACCSITTSDIFKTTTITDDIDLNTFSQFICLYNELPWFINN